MSKSIEYLDKYTTLNQFTELRKFKYLIFFSMLNITIVLCKGVFSYRLVEINGYVIQAGQLIAPFWFLICDIIAEVYGYKAAKETIIGGFICQILFTLASSALIRLPYPNGSLEGFNAYHIVFANLWVVNVGVFVAFIVSGFINIRLITKWKILLKGKYFWLRSIGASGVGELFYSLIATFIIQYGHQEYRVIFLMILLSFLLKILYSTILSLPANIVIFFVKRLEKIKDVY